MSCSLPVSEVSGMVKIKGVFFDLGGTLRIAEEVPEHMDRAKARMAELAGAEAVSYTHLTLPTKA